MQADSVQQLELTLRQRGLRPVSIGVSQPSASPQPATPRPVQTPQKPINQPINQPTTQSRQISREVPVLAHQTINSSPVPNPATTVKTPELTNKQRFFLFTQFASFARSGLSISQMLEHTSAKMKPKLHASFAEMVQETSGGMALSESMARRPILFLPDQVAVVKAGEQSGQMEEGFQQLALQAERANGFRMSLGYFFIVFPFILLCGVGGIGLQKASQANIKKQFDADGQLPVVGSFLTDIKGRLGSEFLLAILLAVGFIVGMILLHKYPFRKFRHKMGLRLPVAMARSRSETVERFSWAMSSMLKGGASPASAIHIAAASIPNLELRDRALKAIGSTRENETLASLLERSGILSPEYVHMVQNGELVGDTPGALNSIARAESDQFQAKTTSLKVVVNVGTMLFMAIFTAVLVGFCYYLYASGMVKMLNDVQ